MTTKLLSARASTRTALQQPSVSAFMKATNSDSSKMNLQPSSKKKKKGGGISLALQGQF